MEHEESVLQKNSFDRTETDPSFHSLHMPGDPFNVSFIERKSQITEAIYLVGQTLPY